MKDRFKIDGDVLAGYYGKGGENLDDVTSATIDEQGPAGDMNNAMALSGITTADGTPSGTNAANSSGSETESEREKEVVKKVVENKE